MTIEQLKELKAKLDQLLEQNKHFLKDKKVKKN